MPDTKDTGPSSSDFIEGEVLETIAPDPEAADVTPGWIGRNRAGIERGRQLTRVLMPLSPPPARLALAGASVFADMLLLADDVKRRRASADMAGLQGGALLLEGAAILAMSRFAPATLARNIAGIEAARRALGSLNPAKRGGAA